MAVDLVVVVADGSVEEKPSVVVVVHQKEVVGKEDAHVEQETDALVVGLGIHYNMTGLVVLEGVVRVAAGVPALQPSYHRPVVVCNNSGRGSMLAMMHEVLGCVSSTPQQMVVWGMDSLLNGIETVEGDQICYGDYMFVEVAPPTFCHNIVQLWQVWHEDRITPHICSLYHQMSVPI